MRGDASSHEVVRARTVDELCAAVAEGFRPLAGGTDLMVLFAAGKLADKKLVDTWGVDALRGIEVADDAVTLGALTTYTDVQAHAVLREEFPMLCRAAGETGGWAIQNRGTLGGNIANASPAADSPPALLAYGAELVLRSKAGERRLDYAAFHTGYKKMDLRDGEVITRIRVPRARGRRLVHFYRKVGPRRAQAISKVCFAATWDPDAKVARIALGAVGPTIARCPKTEAAIAAEPARAREVLRGEIAPIDDIRSTERYRRQVAENLLGEFLGLIR